MYNKNKNSLKFHLRPFVLTRQGHPTGIKAHHSLFLRIDGGMSIACEPSSNNHVSDSCDTIKTLLFGRMFLALYNVLILAIIWSNLPQVSAITYTLFTCK